MVAWRDFPPQRFIARFCRAVSLTILTSATRVQELAVQRIASPAAASLLLGACGSAWLTTHCAAADTGRKDDPVLFGAEVEEQASMNDNNRRYFSPEQKVTIFREH